MDFVIAFGLLKRLKLVRKITRVLSVAAVVCALIVICLVAVLLISPNLLGVQTETALADSSVTMLYGAFAAAALLGVVLPLIIFRYLGRPNVKEYFGIVE
jgi:Na+/glutamate symporter